MKGIVFNLLEEAVSNAHGADTWDDLLKAAQSHGIYTSLGNYPDDDLLRIVGAASQSLHASPNDIVKWFGNAALPMFAQRYAQFFRPHTTTVDFLLTLNDIIHPEVRKLYPGAQPPSFVFSPIPAGLRMEYRSSRQLCALAEGLIEGAAAHYHETATVTHRACVQTGAPACVLDIQITRD